MAQSVRFPGRVRRGILGRFGGPELVALGVAGGVVVICAFSTNPIEALVRAAPLWLVALGCGVIEIDGIPLLSWMGWVIVFGFRAAAGQTEAHRPAGSAPARVGTMHLPGGLARVRLFEDAGHGFLVDAKRRTATAVLDVHSPSFALSESSRKVLVVDRWGELLAQLQAHPGLVGIQVLLSTTATSPTALRDEVRSRGAQVPPWLTATYEALLEEVTTDELEHRALLAVTVSTSALSRQIKAHGGGLAGQARVLGDEVRALTTALRDGQMGEAQWLSARETARIIREAFDPSSAVEIAGRSGTHAGVAPSSAGPMGVRIHADRLETDGVLASTWEVTEWPRTPTSPAFLREVISLDVTHTMSMTYVPLSNREAMRRFNSTLSDIDSERLTAARGGGEKATRTFLRDREERQVVERMQDFSEGHTDLELVAAVTVYGRDRDELQAAEQALRNAASRARIEVRRMWFRQDSGFNACALPLTLGARIG